MTAKLGSNKMPNVFKKEGFKRAFYFIIVLLVLFAVWWILSVTAFKDTASVPSPPQVAARFFELSGSGVLWSAAWNTILKSLIGFCIAFILGLLTAVPAALFPRVKYCIDPVVTLIRSFPTLALTLVLLLWLKTNTASVIVAMFIIFPVFYAQFTAAFQNIDRKLVDMAKAFGVKKPAQILKIYTPGVAPYMFSAALAAFSLNLKVVIASEVIGLPAGATGISSIGFFMTAANKAGDFAAVFAWVAAAVLLAFTAEGITKLIMRLCMPWKYTLRKKIVALFRRIKSGSGTAEKTAVPVKTSSYADKEPQSVPVVFENVTFSYPAAPVLKDFSAVFSENKIHVLLGASGSGKTTLLHLAAGLLKPQSGSVRADGKFSYMFQEPRLIPEKTVLDNLLFVLEPALAAPGKKRKDVKAEARAHAVAILSAVGLEAVKDAYPAALSGGMAQRVSLARAFLVPSDVLCVDEPFKSLDQAAKDSLSEMFLKMPGLKQKTVLWITHDVAEAEKIADEIHTFQTTAPACAMSIR